MEVEFGVIGIAFPESSGVAQCSRRWFGRILKLFSKIAHLVVAFY